MANHKEISEIVKKCKILLLDIEGTTTSISFVKDKLFPYAEENAKSFLDSQWETDDVKEVVAALRKQALEDEEKSVEGAVKIPGEDAKKEEQIEGLVGNVKWQMSADRKVGPLKQLQGLIWKQGYESGDIKGHVYDDVSPALELWRATEGHKVYIYSSGSVQAQKLLFGQSVAGDMLKFIDGHFDTAVGPKQEEGSYKKIVEEIGCKADEVLFLTDIVKEAESAAAAGLLAALVSRAGNAPLPAAPSFPVLLSLDQLAASNKRKTDDQDVQPAKIPKTDKSDDVSSSADDTPAKTENGETEKMEVENEATAKVAEPIEEAKESPASETKVEEITDSNEAVDATPIETDPIITEASEPTEQKTEEKPMDTDAKTEESAEPKVETTEAKETPAEEKTVVVTAIEEVSDKQALDEVADIIENLEPVVEEPSSVEAEMAELQNVGEVLEKECDEILSKVQDVTNLENIAGKPLLNPISEEMETENLDSNDIVDRILDTELELEMRSEKLAKEAEKTEEKPKEVATNGDTEKEVPKETVTDTPVEEKVVESAEPKPAESNGDSKAEPEKTEATKEETPEESKVEATKETVEEKTPTIPEVQVNGNAINGNGDAVNGDAKEDATSRLTENGKTQNGTNGDAAEIAAAEVAEIKVKSVAADRPDPIEQPTEA